MELYEFEPWIDVVTPFPGESLSHFLGRFERANQWSAYQIGRVTDMGAVVSRWKKLYFNPFPNQTELEALAKVVEIDLNTLRSLLPPQGFILQPRPIRLCAACYSEESYHRTAWQLKGWGLVIAINFVYLRSAQNVKKHLRFLLFGRMEPVCAVLRLLLRW